MQKYIHTVFPQIDRMLTSLHIVHRLIEGMLYFINYLLWSVSCGACTISCYCVFLENSHNQLLAVLNKGVD